MISCVVAVAAIAPAIFEQAPTPSLAGADPPSEASAAAKGLIRQFDGTSLLVAVLMNSQIDDYLMQECVRMLDCLQGSEGILEAIRHAQQKSASVLAQLIWHLRDRAKKNNEQLQQMPPAKLLRAALSSLEAYPNDAALHGAVFTLVAELMLEEEFRSAFVEVGGWPKVCDAPVGNLAPDALSLARAVYKCWRVHSLGDARHLLADFRSLIYLQDKPKRRRGHWPRMTPLRQQMHVERGAGAN